MLTVTRLAREWQVTFARREPMEVIGDGGTITIRGTKFLLSKVAEKSSAGGVRWISPFRLVRVHWLPGYVPDVCIHNFLSQFVPVASILPERATEGFENGVRRAKVGRVMESTKFPTYQKSSTREWNSPY